MDIKITALTPQDLQRNVHKRTKGPKKAGTGHSDCQEIISKVDNNMKGGEEILSQTMTNLERFLISAR
jgi:hypothetical protein